MKLTLLLILINVAVFVYSLNSSNNILNNYGFSAKNFHSGKYYVVLTSVFLHANWLHIASNMIALFFLGWTIEKYTKSWQYISVYLLSGILSSLSTLIPIFGYSPETIAVGASGAISGLVGFGTFMIPGKLVVFPSVLPLPFVVAGAIYMIVTFANLFSITNVAYSAHFFGIIGGALVGLIFGENRIKRLSVFILIILLMTGLPLVIGYLFIR